MIGRTLEELGVTEITPDHVSVKESVFPFVKFDDVDTILGPEMRSTGEVMGIDKDFAQAFLKAQTAAGTILPSHGTAFMSLRSADKEAGRDVARGLVEIGFSIVATHGTAADLRAHGIEVSGVNKVLEGHPHCVDAMMNGDIDVVFNTTEGREAIRDSHSLRRTALLCGISYFTTIRAAHAAVSAIAAQAREGIRVQPLQRYH
jgi:carbamoyl-phosphate synthase large subunit